MTTRLEPLLRTWQEDAARRPAFRVLLRVSYKHRWFEGWNQVIGPWTAKFGQGPSFLAGHGFEDASRRAREAIGYPQVTP